MIEASLLLSPILYETTYGSRRNSISNLKNPHLSRFRSPKGSLHFERLFGFYRCRNCARPLDNFRQTIPGGCRPKQMETTFPFLLRIWLRLIPLSDLLENVCDPKSQTLFQSYPTRFGNRFPVMVPMINWIAFSIALMEHLLQVQFFTNLFPVSRADRS